MAEARSQNPVFLSALLETIWWILTAIVVFMVLHPIHKAMYVWPFENWNIVFVVTLITFTRYIFLLKHTFLAKQQVAKIVLIVLMFPIGFLLVDGLHGFMSYVNNFTWDQLTGHLPSEEKRATETYIWGEMLFFGAGSIIATPVLAGRLFMSVWRTKNRGTV
jgi:hypothetical protein